MCTRLIIDNLVLFKVHLYKIFSDSVLNMGDLQFFFLNMFLNTKWSTSSRFCNTKTWDYQTFISHFSILSL